MSPNPTLKLTRPWQRRGVHPVQKCVGFAKALSLLLNVGRSIGSVSGSFSEWFLSDCMFFGGRSRVPCNQGLCVCLCVFLSLSLCPLFLSVCVCLCMSSPCLCGWRSVGVSDGPRREPFLLGAHSLVGCPGVSPDRSSSVRRAEHHSERVCGRPRPDSEPTARRRGPGEMDSKEVGPAGRR